MKVFEKILYFYIKMLFMLLFFSLACITVPLFIIFKALQVTLAILTTFGMMLEDIIYEKD